MNIMEEVREKEGRVRDFMRKTGLKGILLKKQANFSWITGGSINMVPVITELGFTSILITEHEKFLIADRIEALRNMEEEGLQNLGYVLLDYEWFEYREQELVKKIVPETEKVGCDVPAYGLRNVGEAIKKLRFSLTPGEIERYLWLGERVSQAIESVLLDLKPGQTEAEVTGELARLLWKDRIDPVGYQAAADERAYRYRHPIPTERKIKQYLMLCVMARKWGLMTTITRLAHFGKIPEKLRQQYRDNVYIECAMLAHTRPGVKVAEIFQKTCNLYEELGYHNEWKLHHQGGAMGYDVRDYIAHGASEEVVQEKQAFCWNPSISGTKSEDGFIVHQDGFHFITHPVLFPSLRIELEGSVFERPDILEK